MIREQIREIQSKLSEGKIQTSFSEPSENLLIQQNTNISMGKSESGNSEECRCRDKILKGKVTLAQIDKLGKYHENCCCFQEKGPPIPLEADCGYRMCYCSRHLE